MGARSQSEQVPYGDSQVWIKTGYSDSDWQSANGSAKEEFDYLCKQVKTN